LIVKAHATTIPIVLLALGTLVLLGLGVRPASVSALQKKKSAPKRVSVDLGGGVVMKLVGIKPGKFKMGTPKSEQEYIRTRFGDIPGNYAAEETPHDVEITKPFYMGVYEVTQAEYEKVMGKNPSAFSATGGKKDKVAGMDTSRFPVERVSWDDAMEFCRKLSKRFKKNFDLPTEAEWEYACRAGTKGPFHYGNTLSSKQANFNGGSPYGAVAKGPSLPRTTQVGSYKPNAFGLYDMHGNVSEWCKDWIDRGYYKKSPLRDPQGPPDSKAGGDYRVMRGGAWDDYGYGVRSAARRWVEPTNRFDTYGFRVVVRLP
jgi:formylglycine-generating enzyme required for sulfatase activity